MDFSSLSNKQRESFFIRYIIKYLQEFGGQAERSAIRERLLDENEDVAKFAEITRASKKTGVTYRPFLYNFNFAFKDLAEVGLISYSRTSPLIVLTEKGSNINLESFNPEAEVYEVASNTWSQKRKEKADQSQESDEDDNASSKIDDFEEEFKEKLLDSISKMSPKKFELFSRALLNKMGVEFTATGTQISNDGGIDGYGYCRTDDFRTSRVVIQCKRWQGNVGSTEIDQFLGAMNKFQADYGIFITNSRYTPSARDAARAGTPITLIDGDELVRLVKKYQLYIIPVTTYILDDFYENE